MAATPEKLVKQKVIKILKAAGAYYFYPVASGFMSSGVPDIVACYKGKFIGVECKSGKNKPTELQLRNLAAIKDNGGFGFVINEENIYMIEEFLQK